MKRKRYAIQYSISEFNIYHIISIYELGILPIKFKQNLVFFLILVILFEFQRFSRKMNTWVEYTKID